MESAADSVFLMLSITHFCMGVVVFPESRECDLYKSLYRILQEILCYWGVLRKFDVLSVYSRWLSLVHLHRGRYRYSIKLSLERQIRISQLSSRDNTIRIQGASHRRILYIYHWSIIRDSQSCRDLFAVE